MYLRGYFFSLPEVPISMMMFAGLEGRRPLLDGLRSSMLYAPIPDGVGGLFEAGEDASSPRASGGVPTYSVFRLSGFEQFLSRRRAVSHLKNSSNFFLLPSGVM